MKITVNYYWEYLLCACWLEGILVKTLPSLVAIENLVLQTEMFPLAILRFLPSLLQHSPQWFLLHVTVRVVLR